MTLVNQPLKKLKHWPWLPIALVAYYLPWVWHPAAALTANAYDLAEWVSIHPAVRNGDPPLVAPFLLRAVLAGLALLCGLSAIRVQKWWVRWLYGALAVILAITLLPPPDFFRGAGDDPNYRQQFGLAVGTFIVLTLFFGLRRRLARYSWLLEAIVVSAALIAGCAGVVMALRIIQSLGVAVTLGGGIVVLFVGLLPVLVAAANEWRSQAAA